MLALNPSLASLAADAREAFQAIAGKAATLTVAAPGRVNVIGEHIDYCDGFVLPCAIERWVVIAARPNGTTSARIASAHGGEPAVLDLSAALQALPGDWANYLRGVIHGFQQRGIIVPGFDAFIVSSVPSGGGLSSSAALETATATLLEALSGTTLDPREKAKLCQTAEHDFAGVPCGIMDQFASSCAVADHLLLIDCRSNEAVPVPFANPGLSLLVANTRVHHQLSDGGYAARRNDTVSGLATLGKASWRQVSAADVEAAREALGDQAYRRSRHVVGEIQRTVDAAAALRRGDFGALGPLMAASHSSLRDDFEVSCAELDLMVDLAQELGRAGGVLGSRMTGGGFGGSTITLCETAKVAAIAGHLHEHYLTRTRIVPEIFATRPAGGARVLD